MTATQSAKTLRHGMFFLYEGTEYMFVRFMGHASMYAFNTETHKTERLLKDICVERVRLK